MENIRCSINDEGVHIEIDEKEGTSIKTIALSDFINILTASLEGVSNNDSKVLCQSLLPATDTVKTIAYKRFASGRECFVLLKQASKIEYKYWESSYDIPVPNLLFAVFCLNGRFQGVKVAAVKFSKIIQENTVIFKYPFSNAPRVEGYACLGSNTQILAQFKIDNANLHKIPGQFLSMINNNDGFSSGNNSKNLNHTELIEYLVEKNKFPDDLLISAGITLNNWVEKL